MTAILLFGGQMFGAFFLLKNLGVPVEINELRPWTLYQYFTAYSQDHFYGEKVKIAAAASVAPAILTLLMVVVALVVKKSPMENLYGNASFAKLKEISDAGMLMRFGKKRKDKWPAVLLGKVDNKNYVVDASQEYTALAAPPGSGKGVSFVIPNLLTYPHSVINFDPKSENFTITSGYRSAVLGQKVFRFSPDNKPSGDPGLHENEKSNTQTHCWNPLDYINTDPTEILADIRKITSLLIPAPDGENISFYQGAQQGLDGIILYLMETESEEKTIYRAWEINNNPAGIDKWAASTVYERRKSGAEPLSDTCINLVMSYANEQEKKRDTTKSIINTNLAVFTDAKTRAATSKSDFSFESLRREKVSVYVCIAPTNIPRYQNMLNLFFSQALSVNTEVLPEDDPSLKYQCLALLDEFVALGRIELIRASSGYTRAYNVRYAIVFQNISQVNAIYGSEGAQSMLETFHNSITFAVPSPKEAADVSSKLGNTTVRLRETSQTRQSKGGSSTRNWVTQSRALMLPQEIQYLPYEEQIIFKGGGRVKPIHCKKIVWYNDKNFKDKAGMKVPSIPNLVYK